MADKRTKEILKFIGSLRDWEVKFTTDTIQIAKNIRMYIEECGEEFHALSFCKSMNIAEGDYGKFIHGEWEYSLREIAALDSLWTEFRKSKVNIENIKVQS